MNEQSGAMTKAQIEARDKTEKKLRKIAEDIAATLGCNLSSVSVTIREVAEEDWKAKVWDEKIMTAGDELYQKPGYTCD